MKEDKKVEISKDEHIILGYLLKSIRRKLMEIEMGIKPKSKMRSSYEGKVRRTIDTLRNHIDNIACGDFGDIPVTDNWYYGAPGVALK